MNTLLKHLIFPCIGALLLVSCIKDGETPCGSFIRFEYDYNIKNVDMFYAQASRVDLFMFDGDGRYIGVVSETSAGATFDKDYRIELPEGLDRNTQFLAWSGLYPEDYNHTSLTVGQSTMQDLHVALKAAAGAESDKSLMPLWYGLLTDTELTYTNEVHTISMVKDTNHIRIVLSFEEGMNADVDDFTFTFSAKNNSYDHLNEVADDITRVYAPFYAENDTEGNDMAAVAEFSTLRLMEANDNRLVVMHEGQADPVIDVNLNRYIRALKLAQYQQYSLQEYMDREDEYKIIIFLNSQGGNYMSASITINGWVIREQSVDDAAGR